MNTNVSKYFDNLIEDFIVEYSGNNKPIEVSFKEIVNNFSNDRASHLIHPYPAKLLPNIPFFFLNNNYFTQKNDFILDPFCGSGTVLLESIISGRNVIGFDINPLARLIAEVKTNNYRYNKLIEIRSKLRNNIRCIKETNLPLPSKINVDYWFLAEIKEKLNLIKASIKLIENIKYRKFFLVCFSNLVRKVSLADPRISVPVRLKTNQYPVNHPLREKTNIRFKNIEKTDVEEKFFEIVDNNIKRIVQLNKMSDKKSYAKVLNVDVRNCNKEQLIDHLNGKRYIDMIITSPPYAGAQKYIRSSSLNLDWLDLLNEFSLRELDSLAIGRENYLKAEYKEFKKTNIKEADDILNKIYYKNSLRACIASNYLQEMNQSLNNLEKLLKKNGFLVLVIGNNTICNNEFETQKYITKMIEDLGLTLKFKLIDEIKSYGLMTKRNKTANIITREWILVFKKEK